MGAVLEIQHLSKTFPGQRALDDVDLVVEAGEVHALVGQNGSGKSTLIKILAGYHQPDPGSVAFVRGEPLELGDGKAATEAGIRFVHQDLGLVGALNAVENVAMGLGYQTGRGSRIRWRAEHRRTREALGHLGFPEFDIRAPVATLAPAHRTAVAIARAMEGLETGASLLVLDEPTAALPGAEVDLLFAAVHNLRQRGVSILYVSHHLDEVFEMADRVTVLRDGRRITTTEVSSLDHGGLVELLVGHRIEAGSASWAEVAGRVALLQLRGVSGGTLNDLDLDLHAGEVLGVAGITGSGREHVIGLITGQTPRDEGHVWIGGQGIPSYKPRAIVDSGGAFVPSDRVAQGMFTLLSVRENLTIADLSPHFIGGRLRRKAEIKEALEWVKRLSVRPQATEVRIGSLSGGNQQKVMFGKGLRLAPQVLILDEPTQGIDVGAKEELHVLIDKAAADGAGVLVTSTDTDELVRLCHRVVVLVGGRIAAELRDEEITVEAIEHAQLQSTQGVS